MRKREAQRATSHKKTSDVRSELGRMIADAITGNTTNGMDVEDMTIVIDGKESLG